MQRTFWTWLVAGAAALPLVGCNGGSSEYKPAGELPQTADDHAHDHSAEGPHHGALVELGEEEYHAEIVVDGKTHTLRVYLLGPDARSAVTTAATELTITPQGAAVITLKPAADQPAGEASVFEFQDDAIVHEIAEDEFIHGELAVKIGEKDFKKGLDVHFHGDHDHAGHDHAEHGKDKETVPAEAAPKAE